MNSEILKRLQKVQVEILNEIVKVCDQNEIEYFLIGGTLLGSVRHEGFIPWDDDLDIAMTRENYEIFETFWKNNGSKKYFLQNYKTDINYHLPFSKLRKNGTLFLENEVKNIDMHHGIFVDIFILDTINIKNKVFNSVKFNTYKILNKIIWKKTKLMNCPNNSLKNNTLKKLLIYIDKIVNLRRVRDGVMSFRGKKGENYVNLGSQYGYKKQTFRKNQYYPSKNKCFQDGIYKVPNDWESILVSLYGDYMKLPEEENRVTHSPEKIKF